MSQASGHRIANVHLEMPRGGRQAPAVSHGVFVHPSLITPAPRSAPRCVREWFEPRLNLPNPARVVLIVIKTHNRLRVPGEGTTTDVTKSNGDAIPSRAASFGALLDEGLERSYRLATVILGNEEEAQDATHDAAVRAWQHFGSLRDLDRFDAWFSRILIRVCRTRLGQRRRRIVEIPMSDESTEGGSTDAFAGSGEREALERAIATLDADHRTVIALRYLEDLTVDQIAQRTRTRPGTIKSRLHYALAELRAAYEAADRGQRETRG